MSNYSNVKTDAGSVSYNPVSNTLRFIHLRIRSEPATGSAGDGGILARSGDERRKVLPRMRINQPGGVPGVENIATLVIKIVHHVKEPEGTLKPWKTVLGPRNACKIIFWFYGVNE